MGWQGPGLLKGQVPILAAVAEGWLSSELGQSMKGVSSPSPSGGQAPRVAEALGHTSVKLGQRQVWPGCRLQQGVACPALPCLPLVLARVSLSILPVSGALGRRLNSRGAWLGLASPGAERRWKGLRWREKAVACHGVKACRIKPGHPVKLELDSNRLE